MTFTKTLLKSDLQKPKKPALLTIEVMEVQRGKIQELERQLVLESTRLGAAERAKFKYETRAIAAEENADVLFEAIRILATRVENTTVADRKAREEARKLLEDKKIHPPSSLGSSRERKPVKRSRKTLTEETT